MTQLIYERDAAESEVQAVQAECDKVIFCFMLKLLNFVRDQSRRNMFDLTQHVLSK